MHVLPSISSAQQRVWNRCRLRLCMSLFLDEEPTLSIRCLRSAFDPEAEIGPDHTLFLDGGHMAGIVRG
jgi:hypothetical protein